MTKLAGPKTIPEQIADACGVMILDGRFTAGQRMIEQQIAEQFGVSRGPVREAFRLLQKRRLLDITPRKGAYVLPISLASIADLFDVRIALACLAVRTMCEREVDAASMDKLRQRVDDLIRIANDSRADHGAFGLGMTRAVHAVSRASGNQLVVQLMSELNDQTLWTTIWAKPLDYATKPARKLRAEQFESIFRDIEKRDGATAENKLRAMLEESRDGALAILSETKRYLVAE